MGELHRPGRQRPVRLRRPADRLRHLVAGAAGRPPGGDVAGRSRRRGDRPPAVPGTHPAHLAGAAPGPVRRRDPRARRPDGRGLPGRRRAHRSAHHRGHHEDPRRGRAAAVRRGDHPVLRAPGPRPARGGALLAGAEAVRLRDVGGAQHRVLAGVQPGLGGDHPALSRAVDAAALRVVHRRPGRHRRRAAAALRGRPGRQPGARTDRRPAHEPHGDRQPGPVPHRGHRHPGPRRLLAAQPAAGRPVGRHGPGPALFARYGYRSEPAGANRLSPTNGSER